jgi:hypothetical protein
VVSGYLAQACLLGEPGLVGVRAEVVQCGVPAAGVVPALDPVEDRLVGGRPGGPGTSVEQLGLDGREERLGDGVVPALTAPADREPDAVLVGQAPVLGAGVWQPRSEWKITPRAGRRLLIALVRAWSIRSVRR